MYCFWWGKSGQGALPGLSGHSGPLGPTTTPQIAYQPTWNCHISQFQVILGANGKKKTSFSDFNYAAFSAAEAHNAVI